MESMFTIKDVLRNVGDSSLKISKKAEKYVAELVNEVGFRIKEYDGNLEDSVKYVLVGKLSEHAMIEAFRGGNNNRIGAKIFFLSRVLEYLAAEILFASIEITKKASLKILQIEHIREAIENDSELFNTFYPSEPKISNEETYPSETSTD